MPPGILMMILSMLGGVGADIGIKKLMGSGAKALGSRAAKSAAKSLTGEATAAATKAAPGLLQRTLANPLAQSGVGMAGFMGGMTAVDTMLGGGHGMARDIAPDNTVDDIARFGQMFDSQQQNFGTLQQHEQMRQVLAEMGIDFDTLARGGLV